MQFFRCLLGSRFGVIGLGVIGLCFARGADTDTDFAARFAHPPAEARIIKIIHNWPDQPEAQDALIQRLQAQGFGGVVCNVSFDQYLESDEKWTAFRRALEKAKQAGMALWLYDERGYPSGNAGGLVLRNHPEWEARGLLVADTECGAGPLELSVPPGSLFLAVALPVRNGQLELKKHVDLTTLIQEGKLRWSAPEGRWHVMVVTESRLYEGTHADGNLHEKMPYINLLRPEPTKEFLDLTYERYAKQLGPDLGKKFVASFTDEPSLMSCFLKPMPWRPLPWSPNLPVEFKRRRGHTLDASVVPALIGEAGPRGAKLRYDFWLTVGELVSENYFGQIQDRCRKFSLPSGGHLLMEEGLVTHVPFYGDFFRCARRLDAPSIDCLTSVPAEVPWFIARMLGSTAELDGDRIVMSETSDHSQVWRPAGDTRPKRAVTEAEIRGTCNRLIVSGVNSITSYYSYTGLDDGALRRLNEWIGRCCTALTGGHQVADVALVYPIESLWPKFRPARHWAKDSPDASAIENSWRAAMESLFASQRDFTMIDSRTIAEAKVLDSVLVHGSLRWRVLVLPGVDTLPQAAWENLSRFIQKGGVVIALGALPLNNERDFPSREVIALGTSIFGSAATAPQVTRHRSGGAGIYLPFGSEGLLPILLDGCLVRDVTVVGGRSPIRTTHRRIEGREVYFVINDSGKSWEGEVSFHAAGAGEHWDPASSTVAGTNLSARVHLQLQPYGAVLFRYPAALPTVKTDTSDSMLPQLQQRRLPAVEPAMVKGEFVRAEIAPEAAHSQPGSPAWRASAALTKSQVDTFLFMRFIFPQPIELSATDCLVLDTWVPEGQRTGAEILAIVQEQGGGDFLASTGRALAKSGHHRVFVPISKLQLAGWSQDQDGELDLRRVKEIRIGWGGYFGAKGERVEFSVALPQVGVISTSRAQ